MSETATDTTRSPATVVLLVSGMAVFGTATPVSSIVGRGFPTFLAAGLRMATAAAILLPVAAAMASREGTTIVDRLRKLDRRDWMWMAAIAVIGTFLFSTFMVLGMREVPGSVGAVVMAMTPGVTALGAVLLLGERLTAVRLGALGLGIVGVVVVNLSSSSGSGAMGNALLGTALVFAAVCCESVYTLGGKRLGADLDPVTLSAAAAALAFVVFLPVAGWSAAGYDWGRATAGQWLALGWWGLGTMALGSVLWFAGVRRVEGSVAAVFMAVMPVAALVGSYVLLGEAFDPLDAVGMAAVIFGMVLVHREDPQEASG